MDLTSDINKGSSLSPGLSLSWKEQVFLMFCSLCVCLKYVPIHKTKCIGNGLFSLEYEQLVIDYVDSADIQREIAKHRQKDREPFLSQQAG